MKKSTAFQRLLKRTEFYIFLVLIALIVVIQAVSGGQLMEPNIVLTILRTMVVDGLFALGCLMVMVSGGFDMSFPAIAALSYSLATTICLNNGWCATNAWAGFLMSTAFGAVLGMLNGVIISNFALNTMLVTLGTQTFFTGLSMGLFELKEITSTLPKGLRTFGEWSLFEVQNSAGLTASMTGLFLILIAVAIIVSFVLNKTMFGRALYAIGGNEISAERAGFNVKKTKFILYTVVGALAGFTGMIRVCMARQSIPKALVNKEMTIIPAVILGGASIYGGEGSVFGTMTAIAIISLVSNSMLLVGIDTYWEKFFNGLIILIGITISSLQAKRNKR